MHGSNILLKVAMKRKGGLIFDAVNPITYDIINILINVTDSLTLNPNLYNKTDVEKIKYGNIKRKLIEELKIDLNKLIEALKIYIWKNLLKK